MLLRLTLAFLGLAGFALAQTPPSSPSASPGAKAAAPHPKVTYTLVPVEGPYIAITFDDGPNAVQTPRLLKMLAERKIRATFYLVGQCVVEHPEIVRQIVAEGHELGNHSWSHPDLKKMPEANVRSQLERTHQAIVEATGGVGPKTLRPPYGSFSEAQRLWAKKEFGYPTILWWVDPFDWKKPGAEVITRRILAETKPGAIILAHDIHKQTVDAMPATLDGLLAKGYRFVTVSELLAMEKPKPSPAPKPSAAPSASATR